MAPPTSSLGPFSIKPSFLLLLLLVHSTIHAQVPIAPTPVALNAFVRYGSKFYVLGGHRIVGLNVFEGYSQLFYLDLAVPWDITQPAWTKLAGGPDQQFFSAAFSPDGATLVALRGSDTQFAFRYSVQYDQWTNSKATVVNPAGHGIMAVGDPNTGIVYAAGGYDLSMTNMAVYDIAADTVTNVPMPANSWHYIGFYAAVWWQQRQSIVYLGGYKHDPNGLVDPSMGKIFTPSTGQWTTMVYKNPLDRPSQRVDFCIAMNEDGSKMYVFGGRIANGIDATGETSGEMFILDTANMEWSRGQNYTEKRMYASCTIFGNTFIAWGGADDVQTASGTPILYDLTTNRYIQSYTPPKDLKTSAAPSSATQAPGPAPSTIPETSSNQDMGAILGGVFGSISVVALAVIIYFYLRKRQARNGAQNQQQEANTIEAGSAKELYVPGPASNPQDYLNYVPPPPAKVQGGTSPYSVAARSPQGLMTAPQQTLTTWSPQTGQYGAQ